MGSADLGKSLLELLGLKTLLPGLHRACLVKIGHADQVGQLLAPEVTAVFGRAATAAVENRIGQTGAIHQHLAAGAEHRLSGGGGFRVHTFVDLARHGGAEVKWIGGLALPQGVGAGGHGLGPQGRLGPAGRHLAAHHAGQV